MVISVVTACTSLSVFETSREYVLLFVRLMHIVIVHDRLSGCINATFIAYGVVISNAIKNYAYLHQTPLSVTSGLVVIIKAVLMLNSDEHEICPANKSQIAKLQIYS